MIATWWSHFKLKHSHFLPSWFRTWISCKFSLETTSEEEPLNPPAETGVEACKYFNKLNLMEK